MLLTKQFSPQEFARALDAWTWLDLQGKTPVMTSLFGDVFLEDAHGWWYLDTVEGSLTQRWSTTDQLRAALATDEGQDDYLLGGVAMAAEATGLQLGASEVYAFQIAPVIGGSIEVTNITTMGFVVSLTVLGQLHRQVRSHGAGSIIAGFSVDDADP